MPTKNTATATKTVGKQELIRRVTDKARKEMKDLSAKTVTEIINTTLDTVRDSLKKGEEVRLVGFGSFKTRTSAARTGVNPQTRQKIQVAAKRRVRFTAGKELSEAVAK